MLSLAEAIFIRWMDDGERGRLCQEMCRRWWILNLQEGVSSCLDDLCEYVKF
jgi:hypothetical protein